MTAQPGKPGQGGKGPALAVVLIFAVAAVPLLIVVAAWLRGDRTDIALDIPKACTAIDAAALQQLTPGGTPSAQRTVGDSSASDTCTVRGHDATLTLSVGADPQRYDAAHRAAACQAIGASPTTSGSSVSCASSRADAPEAADASRSRVEEYVWARGVYEVHLSYVGAPDVAPTSATTSTTDRIVDTLVAALPSS